MAVDRDALLAAALRNAQATGKTAGLDEQYQRATALRDEAYAEPDSRGWQNPLGALATTMNRSTGRKQVRGVTPAREANRAAIAETEGVGAQGALTLTLDKEDRDIATHDQTLKLALSKDAREAEKLAHEMAQEQGESEVWQDRGGKEFAVTYDNKGVPQVWSEELDRMAHPQELDLVPVDTGAYSPGKAMTETAKDRVAERVSHVAQTSRVVGNWDKNFGQAYRGLPTKFVQGLADAFARNDLMKYIDESQDPRVKASAQWWADWKMTYEGKTRHDLFGATLTDNEQAAWESMIHMNPGMNPDEIEKRMKVIHKALQESLIKRANIGMADSVEANRGVWDVAMRDHYDYDPGSKEWGIRGAKAAAAQAAADAVVQPMEVPPALQPFYQSLLPEDKAGLEQIKDPAVRLQVLQGMANPAPAQAPVQAPAQAPVQAPVQALPQAVGRRRSGQGIPDATPLMNPTPAAGSVRSRTPRG